MIKLTPKTFFLFSLIAFGLLSMGIFSNYALTDIYEFVWSGRTSEHFKHVFIQGGRPLYGELNQIIFGKLITTISDLKWIRLFSLFFCVLLSTQVFSFLVKLKMNTYQAAIYSFLVLMLPSFSVYISWTATYQIPLALNLSFFAGTILIHNIKKNNKGILQYLFVVPLIICSLTLYQSAATAFIIPFVFYFILNSNELIIKSLIRLIVVFILSFGTYFLLFKLSLKLYNFPPLERSSLDIINLPYKVIKFYLKDLRPFVHGSAILFQSTILLILFGGTMVGFLLLFVKQKATYFSSLADQKNNSNPNQTKSNILSAIKNKQFIFLILFIFGALPLSFLPNLISSENYLCSRTFAPAGMIILFFQFNFFIYLLKKNKYIKYVSLSTPVLFIILGSYNTHVGITQIQSREYTVCKQTFEQNIPLSNTKHVVFIRPAIGFLQKSKLMNRRFADEFGQLSTSRDWVPVPLFKQLFKEKYDTAPSFEISTELYRPDIDLKNSTDTIYINLRSLLQEEFSK